MASPMTHGIPTFLILAIFLVLAVFGATGKINVWDFAAALIFGIGIDVLDHFTSLSYIKDMIRRLKEGGGPKKGVKIPICWLHLWPGTILAMAWGVTTHYLFSALIYFPILMLAIHVRIDYFQKQTDKENPHYHYFYPFIKKTWTSEKGYPIKPVSEFILTSAFWMMISFILLGILIFR